MKPICTHEKTEAGGGWKGQRRHPAPIPPPHHSYGCGRRQLGSMPDEG